MSTAVENQIELLRKNIHEAEELLSGSIAYLRDMKSFGEFYDEQINEHSDSLLVDLYLQAFKQYEDERSYLKDAKIQLNEFLEASEIDGFKEEYEKYVEARKRIIETTNEIFMKKKMTNWIYVYPKGAFNWFHIPYISNLWNTFINDSEHIINTYMYTPVVEVLQMGDNLNIVEEDSDSDIRTMRVDLTLDANVSQLFTVDLTDVIKLGEGD